MIHRACSPPEILTYMGLVLSDTIRQRLLRLLSNRAVYHTFFWVGVLVLYSILDMVFTGQGFVYTLSNNVVRLVVLGAAVYYNIYVLIPKYLATKKFVGYVGFLLLFVFIVSPGESFLIFVKSENVP